MTTSERTDSMTAATSSWDAQTTPAGVAPGPRPSSMALATRSLSAAGWLTGTARRDALQDHFASFPPSIGSSCAVRR
jgi:hypothetical protein